MSATGQQPFGPTVDEDVHPGERALIGRSEPHPVRMTRVSAFRDVLRFLASRLTTNELSVSGDPRP